MHISEKAIEQFEQTAPADAGEMDTAEMIAFLEHLDQCDYCLEAVMQEEERNTQFRAPDYLAEQILARASAPDVQAAKVVRATSRKMQLFYYGLRTAAGVVAALFLLFGVQKIDFSALSGYSMQKAQEYSVEKRLEQDENVLSRLTSGISSGLSQGSARLSDYLSGFPNRLLSK